MIPVTLDIIDQLIERPPVLMLDRNSIGVAYVDFLVRLSPRHITSKDGHKYLPLELWLMILEFAQAAPQSRFRGLDRKGTCDLVIPLALGVNTNGIPTVSCQLLSRPQFGLLKHWDLARLYRHYLKRPHLQLLEAKNPFDDLSTPRATFIQLPVSCLASRIPTLFFKVKIQDVIWCVEAGECGLCNRTRKLRVRGEEWRLLCRYFEITTGIWGDEISRGLCPLCVGEKYFWKSVELQETDPRHEHHLSPEEYDAWERRRLAKLGFDS